MDILVLDILVLDMVHEYEARIGNQVRKMLPCFRLLKESEKEQRQAILLNYNSIGTDHPKQATLKSTT